MIITALLLAATLQPFDQVVASERAFAAASLSKGLHEAFLANLAPEAISFMPLPVSARATHEGKPPAPGKLNWGPSWVAVSSAGDLALSTGPWEIKHNVDALVKVSTGLFFSVWRRQPDGAWKVAVDAGISSPLTFSLPTKVENGFAGLPAAGPLAGGADKARTAVKAAEQALDIAAKAGLGKAVQAQADPLLRVYREGKPPGIGPEGSRALLAADTRKMVCNTDRVIASASGDLAYAYGACVGEGADDTSKYGFLRVWRIQPTGAWKLLADVTP
jgi:ketosteroid isomerase-like protein